VPTSLSIFKFHTAGGFKEAVKGAIVDKINFTFDGVEGSRREDVGPGGRPSTRIRLLAAGRVHRRSARRRLASSAISTSTEPRSSCCRPTVTVENNNDLRRNELGNLGIATGIISHTRTSATSPCR
jgi:hypothetical protein